MHLRKDLPMPDISLIDEVVDPAIVTAPAPRFCGLDPSHAPFQIGLGCRSVSEYTPVAGGRCKLWPVL